jgi:hypothetical protein
MSKKALGNSREDSSDAREESFVKVIRLLAQGTGLALKLGTHKKSKKKRQDVKKSSRK